MSENLNKNLTAELQSAYLYQALADAESQDSIRRMFLYLKREAETQAKIWAEKIEKQGGKPPSVYRPSLRARGVVCLLHWLGARHLHLVLAAMKVRGLSVYHSVPVGHPTPTRLQEVGRRHKAKGASGILRAAIFGVNDGLVSNASLMMGVAGAATQSNFILLSGIAGLLAGAFSMGAGEYISMRSQREMFEHQIGLERAELKEYPQEEAAELALIYQAKGLSEAEAQELSQKLIADPEKALDTLAREELGLNPDELGSPWGAAIFSFLFFSFGALVPLLPFVFASHPVSLILSLSLTGAALFLVGALMSLFTGRNFAWGGLRMLLIGGGACAATFLIGKVLGVSLGY